MSGRPRRLGLISGSVVAAALGVALTSGIGAAASKRPVGRIVFTASVDRKNDVYVVRADGSRRKQLTQIGTAQSPDWSPDGKSLLFTNTADGPGGAVYRMGANGRQTRLLFRESQAHQILQDPVWSPDGRRIAFATVRTGTFELWTYSLSGTFRQITHEGFAVNPTWSPDGKQIAYDGIGQSPGHATIFVAAADGTGRRDVSHAPFDDSVPVWSPTGQWIALRSLNHDWETHEADSLVIVNPAGTVRKTLVTGGGIFPADWSPKGDAILFLWIKDPGNPTSSPRQLYTVPLTGGTPRPVPGTRGAFGSASWHR